MADNSTSSTNQRDIDEIWASLLRGDEPLRQEPTARAVERDSAVLPATPTAATDPAALYISENPFDDSEEDYQEDWLATLPRHPTLTDRRRAGASTVIEVMSYLRQSMERYGGLSWYQLTRAVQMAGGDEYKVRRIAEKLADADVAIIERPRRQTAGHGATDRDEQLRYEKIARTAFAELAHRTATWQEAAAELKGLRRRVTPELRPRILEYYTMHRLNRTDERALFAQLEALREAYPDLDPRTQRSYASADIARLKSLHTSYQHCHKQEQKAKLYREYLALRAQLAERETTALGRWRSQPEVAAIYDAITSDQLWVLARLALRYQGHGLEFDDLFQEGYTGLLQAIEAFRPAEGKRFVLCASFWMKQRIRRAIDLYGNIISLPVHMWERHNQANLAYDELVQKLGHQPYDWEVARATGLKPGMWTRLNAVLDVRPLQCCPPGQVADSGDSAYDLMMGKFVRQVLATAIERYCSERNRIIVAMRLNLDQDFTLERIAGKFSLTRERVRQLVEKFTASRMVRAQICGALEVPMPKPKQQHEEESNDA